MEELREVLNEQLLQLLVVLLPVVVTMAAAIGKFLFARVELWFNARMLEMPDQLQMLYEIAAQIAVEYVEQMYTDNRVEFEDRFDLALEKAVEVLSRLGVKNVDPEMLEVFIEAMIQRLRDEIAS